MKEQFMSEFRESHKCGDRTWEIIENKEKNNFRNEN